SWGILLWRYMLLPCDQSIFQKTHLHTSFGLHPMICCTTGTRQFPTTITSWRPPQESFRIRNGKPGSDFSCSRRSDKRAETYIDGAFRRSQESERSVCRIFSLHILSKTPIVSAQECTTSSCAVPGSAIGAL